MAALAPDTRAHTFDGLPERVVSYALRFARTLTARRGDVLTRQGRPARQILVVREGFAKLVSTSADGHEILVGIAGPRDAFGHSAMAESPRDYLVTSCALGPVTAAVWDRETALAIANEYPEVDQKINAQLLQNLQLVLGRLHTVSEGRVGRRLALALVELAARHGVPDGTDVRIAPPLTRQDIAALVGTTVFTASRLLSDWEQQGLVRSTRARVAVCSLEGLRLIAGDATA